MDGWEWTAPNRNKYRLRLGLAVTDLGTIRYANAAYVRQAVLASTRTVRLGQLDTLHFKTLQSVGTTVDKLGSLHQMHSWRFLVEFRKSRVPLGELGGHFQGQNSVKSCAGCSNSCESIYTAYLIKIMLFIN